MLPGEKMDIRWLASEHQFGVLACVDKNLAHQQDLSLLALPVAVLDVHRKVLPGLGEVPPGLLEVLGLGLERKIYVVR